MHFTMFLLVVSIDILTLENAVNKEHFLLVMWR